MRLLELPRDSTVPGPGQVNNNFSADPTVSNELNILRPWRLAGGARQPADPAGRRRSALRAAGLRAGRERARTFPLLQRVLVAFGDEIGFADTLDGALDQVFGGDSGADAGDAGTVARRRHATGRRAPHRRPPGRRRPRRRRPTRARTRPPAPTSTRRCSRPSQAISDGQAALAIGDFAAYGEAQKRLETAVQNAVDAEARARPVTVPPIGGGDVRHRRSGGPRFGRPWGVG